MEDFLFALLVGFAVFLALLLLILVIYIAADTLGVNALLIMLFVAVIVCCTYIICNKNEN